MREKHREFLEKKAKLMEMGGPERVEKQHAAGKLTARERLNLLFDEGTFEEVNLFVKHRCTMFGMEKREIPADGVICGFGKVNGRLTYAYAQDFTSMGGALGEMHGKKIQRLQEEACRVGAPIVAMCDGGGARIQEGNDTQPYNYVMQQNVFSSGRIPQVSAIMGPSAGGASYSPALTDMIITVDGTSKMFLTGPKVIREVTGEEVDEAYYGGGRMLNEVSGVAHRLAVDDYDCIEQVKQYLSYFPQNYKEKPPVYAYNDDPNRLVYELDEIIPENPRTPYDMHQLLSLIFDEGSIFEFQPMWARNAITAYCRLNGHSVGVIANNPMVMAGALDIDASDKICRFINTCDAFNIPLLYVTDAPGFIPGIDQESNGIIRHGAKIIYANCCATVPKIRLTVRKLYGGATAAMCDTGESPDYTISWPAAEEAVMGAAGACGIIFAKEIKNAENPEEVRAQKIAEYEKQFSNPYFKASRMYTDLIIEPNETRKILIRILEALENKEVEHPKKKHGIFPC